MTKLKTYLLLWATERRWISFLLTRFYPGGHDACRSPDPNPGDADRWAYLTDLAEMPRYAVIVGYVRRLRPNGAVLDVGSSRGLLAEELKHDVARYRGIERDPTSVDMARLRNLAGAEFEVADANHYTTDDTFDVIIFNEVIYYLTNPAEVLRRYGEFLKPDGIMIISNYVARHLLRLPREIARSFELIDQATVINSQGIGWSVQAVRTPKRCESLSARPAEQTNREAAETHSLRGE
jgi:SAM-dependent methyltransferase